MSAPRSALSPSLIAAIEAGACVLTPNRRSAHALKLLYANHAVSQGRKVWLTPAIYSFQVFLQRWWSSQTTRSARLLNSEQCRVVWERVVAKSSWSSALLSPQAAATSSFRSWERMQAWCIESGELARQADLTQSNEAHALLDWSDRFAALCKQNAWLPSAQLPQALSDAPLPAFFKRIAIVGAAELQPAQQQVLKQLAARGAEIIEIDAGEAIATPGELRVMRCESPALELHAAALWAREQLEQGAKSVGIAVPNLNDSADQARRAFAEVFDQPSRLLNYGSSGDSGDEATSQRTPSSASFSIANYRRLADFPLASAALDVLALCAGRVDASRVGMLLRSNFIVDDDAHTNAGTASRGEASARALADAYLRARTREHYDLTALELLATHAQCPSLTTACRRARESLGHLPPRMPPSVIAEAAIAMWNAFGWPGDLVLDSHEQQIKARMHEALAEFGALDELLGPMSFAAGIREFEQWVRNSRYEPRAAATPITIVDADAIDGLSFNALWVVGVDESRWPPPATPDPFIPTALQMRAGMPGATATLAREHARRRFDALKAAAKTIVFSWARRDGDIDVLPSPWLAQIDTHEESTNTTTFATTLSYASAIFAAKPQLETLAEATAPSVGQGYARGGSRIFELQAQCPFRAYAELRLDAKPLNGVVPSVDARDRGKLIHAALADLWRELKDFERLRLRTNEQLISDIRTLLSRHLNRLLEGASPHRIAMLHIELELAAERIVALLKLDRERSPFQVLGNPETPAQLNIGTLNFELRLDRVDELLDSAHRGQRVIVDYKTGNVAGTQSWLSARPEQPQLPLYAVTHPQSLAAVVFASVGAGGAFYQGIAQSEGIFPGVKAFDKDLPPPWQGWSGLLDYWRTVITSLANEFARGNAVVDPLPAACRYCHLSALCRIDEQAARVDEDAV